MVGKRKGSPDSSSALPASSTSRVLRPRSRATSLTRAAYSATHSHTPSHQGASISRPSSRSHSHRSPTPDPTTHLVFEDHPIAGPSGLNANSSGQGGSKRRRLQTGGVSENGESEEEEEVDELVSDGEHPAEVFPAIPLLAGPSTVPMTEVPGIDEAPGDIVVINAMTSSSPSTNSIPVQSSPTPIRSPTASPVSSPSLAKILHSTNVEPHKPTMPSLSSSSSSSQPHPPSSPALLASPTHSQPQPTTIPEPEPLASYTCPICFSPPTNATLTPCGHICCGSCLFTAVKSTMQRNAIHMVEQAVASCPVCRAPIPGWDGRGGGVVGLKVRAVFSL